MIRIFPHSFVKFHFLSSLDLHGENGRKHILLKRIFVKKLFSFARKFDYFTQKVCSRKYYIASHKVVLLMEVEEKENEGEKTNSFLLQANFMFLKRLEFPCTIFSLHNSWYNFEAVAEVARWEKKHFHNTKKSERKMISSRRWTLCCLLTQRDGFCS